VTAAQSAIAGTLEEIERTKRMLTKATAKQVRAAEPRQYLRAVAHSWFQSHRPLILPSVKEEQLNAVDDCFRTILDSSERMAARSTYTEAIRAAKAGLIELRGLLLSGRVTPASTTDLPPDFSNLASDPVMRWILTNRWNECTKCVEASAFLAATVMMGGLLEALLVARANRMSDKRPLFSASSAPIDPKTKKPLDLRQWTLAPYIDVAHELGWITRSAKDVATVLRDYRNYVHPEKERSHGVTLVRDDAVMFWEVVKTLTRQLLASARP
jgi:hypothetical protein